MIILSPQEKISQILRMDRHAILLLEKRLSDITGKTGVIESIVKQNEDMISHRFLELGVSRDARAAEIFEALISKVEADDSQIYKGLGNPRCQDVADCQRIAEIAKKVVNPPKGLFLKLDKAREFLLKEPPKTILSFLGYDSAEKMLAEEDLFEVYSSLRFVEGSDWLNKVFFKQYENLKPSDFEEREIRVRALSKKWAAESDKFVAKKHHNISHLKELGVVFIIPTFLGISGEILRMFALIMHYLFEIPFYSDMFRRIGGDDKTFTANLVSLLRGDVLEKRVPEGEKLNWLVVQRYLTKEDPNDWRLFTPHINPEALHWLRATERLVSLGEELDGFERELAFWHDLDWVGDYFKDDGGIEVLISFNLVDTVMSLVKQKEMTKYLYHHQEALWNKIFSEYFGLDMLEEYSKKYLLRGYFQT